MPNETLHSAWHIDQVIGQDGIGRQVALYDNLSGKRHTRAGKVIGLHKRVRDETSLGTTSTVSVTKYNHGKIEITYKPRYPIINCSHRK